MENSSSETLHVEDLQTEIMSWLPLKSLLRFVIVSKKWASIIRGEQFKALYLRRSMTRPRLMFMVRRIATLPPEPEMVWFQSFCKEERCIPGQLEVEFLFHSVYQEKIPYFSSGQQQLRVPPNTNYTSVSQPIGGLICLQSETKFALCNPGTKKSRALPDIQAHEKAFITSFLGYDEATNVFKVLCLTMVWAHEPSKRVYEYQVLTVESGVESCSWRGITCKEKDHTPETQGLCKGGVLYYGARSTSDHRPLVMSFNVRSQEFTAIELPDQLHISYFWNFVIYNGDIALVNESDFDPRVVNEPNGNKVFHIWVRDATAQEWQRTRIEIPRWEQNVGHVDYVFRGTTGTKELVFAQDSRHCEDDFFVLYYDTFTKDLRRFQIGVTGPKISVRTCLDHVDSLWLM
ncbi:putative F-box protein [Arabidopsis thaliana]|uniref:Putative F-box protein At1g70970 n=4 Tax=Arabidopsis TaxID=3701 RepID=FB86_ARATH|nr:F-box and associated interaction domains-containing protein [Arabidopsis thaliana]Q9SSK2.1 RecName: Full=Putative F-box protein At1g70970 [Arabidopsis thaliana]KAG7651293.1 F-box associated domain type 3 [Arabidopsis thaliana x Arabidopsis arenosa]KAG7659155.1 F-box associated domain type 3 [Arabidopsis suecica]AAD55510.1 Hypothetical protein [Arabidopsis thaliana]AEE35145.1 F-box and associated interaction domains-containing protein [Arabidopsis thaliana]OAP16103.1 hypothetical protein AX|eukprot:NP_177253.1 F-box and associated interaction domains-containing protein [Arabidopsis thaliana]